MAVNEYYPTKIRPLVQMVARMVQKDPTLADRQDYLMACIQASAEEFKDCSKCEGCGRSMKITLYELTITDMLLVLKMAEAVREKIKQHKPFTEANSTAMSEIQAPSTILKRQTKCDYLGLIKKNPKKPRRWVLTTWAWKALRDERINKAVKYWEGNIIARSKDSVTFGELIHKHRVQVDQATLKKKVARADYTNLLQSYDPEHWRGYGD